jgi:lysozyme family protein
MSEVFEIAFRMALSLEASPSNDPQDPGGFTKFGIAQSKHPDIDVSNLSLEQAKQIYREQYWDRMHCGVLPPGLAIAVFDCAVNQGSIAAQLLQKALNVSADGVIGPKTIRAAQFCNQLQALSLFMAERSLHYLGTGNFDRFGRGWLKRLFVVTAYCLLFKTGGITS